MKIVHKIINTFKVLVILVLSFLVLSPTIMAENTDYEPLAVQRLYNKVNGAHLLSTDQNEVNTLTKETGLTKELVSTLLL